MPKDIVFFNFFHNGDLHVSREIVRKIINRVHQQSPNTQFYYAHNNDAQILSDIPSLNFKQLSSSGITNNHSNLECIGNNLCINTWYAQQSLKYMYDYGLGMDCLYSALNDSCKSVWQFSLDEISSDPSHFFPTIDYSKFEIQSSQTWLNNNPQKKIFVANGHAMSGQAVNFPFTPIICDIARNHPDKVFILSNPENIGINAPNVIYSSNIINKSQGCDLNENSFISSHCDVIIGRGSGAFTFALTQETMFVKKIKFLCFCNSTAALQLAPAGTFWAGQLFKDRLNYTSEFIFNHETDAHIVKAVIEQNI